MNQRSETIAVHWTNPVEHEVNTGNVLEEKNALEDCFAMPELCTAIKRAKPNKHPGPDGIWNWLSDLAMPIGTFH